MWPELAPVGTVVVIEVAVGGLTSARVPLNETRLPLGTVSKLLPVILTEVPAAPMFGVKLVMIGASEPTVKGVALATVPDAFVTEINPVVAPTGTVVEI